MSENKILSRLLNALGLSLVILVIIAVLPLSLPKLTGMKVYGILSDSMLPEYSVGGVVYVKPCDTATLQLGDVITYTLGSDTDRVMTHRIVEIGTDGEFWTKGDNNNSIDANPVNPSRVVGKVVFHLPYLSAVAAFLDSTVGIICTIILFLVAVMLWMLADIVKRSKRSLLRPGIRGLAVLMIVGAVIYLGSTYFMYRDSGEEYQALAMNVMAKNTDMENTSVKKEDSGEMPQGAVVCERVRELMEQNEDTIGWIHFANPEIDYPVMQGEDNEFYLTHSFSKEEKKAGSIFMEVINHPTFEDSHTIIYGHNMRDLSMFGKLKNYKDKDFYEGNEYFTVYTDTKIITYQIFAYYDVAEYSDVYTVWYTPDESFGEMLETMKRKSYYDTKVDVTAEDKVLTLSTCSTTGKRFVVHAKQVMMEEI